jgi:hypothetical protein
MATTAVIGGNWGTVGRFGVEQFCCTGGCAPLGLQGFEHGEQGTARQPTRRDLGVQFARAISSVEFGTAYATDYATDYATVRNVPFVLRTL